ncbi:Zinc finger CCCH domain-containing protein 6 [Trichinella papuae]|uniref:Zinc finger CCCH domain-containing protein 6 n=1 Tax=Trichinella papuae TaxID=268474 RepID=A0A0V1N2M6_9BILA|nr:Zinc finger CCCH domain-containing protein 6 [Trichinella papuae]
MSQMEEGELLEEGEITDDDILFPNPEVNQSENSSESSDSVITTTNKSEFDASLKRKREELAAKLTGQLQDELGEVVEPSKDALDWYAGKAFNGSKSPSSGESTKTIKKTKEVLHPTMKSFQPGNNFYMDLDSNDSSAELLNNWAKVAKNTETSSKLANDATLLVNCDSPSFDPNDEYYGKTIVTSTSSLEQSSGSTTIKSEERGQQQPMTVERVPRSRSNRKRVDERSRTKKIRHNKGGPGGCRSPRPKRKRTSMSPTRSENDSRSGEERPKQEQNAAAGGGGGGGLVRTGRAKRRSSKSPALPARERADRRDRMLCRFFKEGFCREGDRCSYSHVSAPATAKRSPPANASSQNKRKELCKYFASGYCRNGRKCPYMHNDFPCKFFPIGDCRKGERCRYSHAINVDRVNSDFAKPVPPEEHLPPLGSKIASVQLELPTRRKVLLNDPPKQAMLPTPYSGTALLPSPPCEMSTGNCDQREISSSYAMSHDDGISFPYAKMEREYSRISQEPLLETPNIKSENFMAEAQKPSLIDDVEKRKEKEHDDTSTSNAVVPTAKINIIAMLREIKSQVKGADKIQDSPASPEPMKQWVLVPQTVLLVDFKLQLLGDIKRENKVRNMTMVISLKDVKLRADPRVKKYLSSQFDAVSDLFTGSKPLDNSTSAIATASPSANNVREPVDTTSAQDVTDQTSSTKNRSSPSSAVVLGTVDARPRDPRIKTQPGPGSGSGSVPPEMPNSNAILPYDSASNVRMACFPDPIRNYGYGHGGQPMPMEPEMVNPMAYPDMPPRVGSCYNGSNDMFDPYMAAPPAQLNGPAFCPRPDMMGPRHAYAHNGPYGGGPMPSGGGYAGGVSRYRPHGLLYVGDGPVRQRPPQSRMNVMGQPPRPHAKGRIIDPIYKNGPSDPRLKRFAAAAPSSTSTTTTTTTTTVTVTTTTTTTAAADVIADVDAAAVSNSSCGAAIVNQDPSLSDARGSVPASADSLETISNQEKIPSLRERRKDLQYESPLNAGPTV